MKKTSFILLLLIGCVVTSTAQKPSLELTFTAIDSATHIQLDSIKVMNRSQGGDTVLYYPDTILVLDYIVGVEEVDDKDKGLQVYQNYPNPVVVSTTISIYVPEKGLIRCLITDIMGRVVNLYEEVLISGVHSFSYTPGGGKMSFFTAIWQDSRETVKVMHPNLNQSGSASLSYIGLGSTHKYEYKAFEAMQGFSFSLGDTLLYIGYANELESGILDDPLVSDTLYFQYATNIPCPGTPTVTYEQRIYNTIQIYSQCWFKENLNVGEMIPSSQNMSDNSIIERYCLYDIKDSCEKYGALYLWNEMMQYTSIVGSQGICPPGWHIPTDEEWKVLEGVADSQYAIGENIWDEYGWNGWRGIDAGTNMKTTSGWCNGGNGTDLFGFSVLPGGRRNYPYGGFDFLGCTGFFWTSSDGETNYAWSRYLDYSIGKVARTYGMKGYGHSVRCIKD